MSRRKCAEKMAAKVAARSDAQSAPVPALDQTAAANGWLPATVTSMTDEDIGCICRVALGTHGATDPDKYRREGFRNLFMTPPATGPTYMQYSRALLTHCYEGTADSQRFLVGDAFFDIEIGMPPAGYRGPIATPEELAVAFCAVTLPAPLPWVKLIRTMKSWIPNHSGSLGHAELDSLYTSFWPVRGVARRIIGPEVAALVASRDDWGLLVNRATLICVASAPISTGTDAQELAASAIRIASLMPSDPSTLR